MEENQKKAFDFAADLTKLLMTFATAILAFTATFGKEVPHASWWQRLFVTGSWVFYICSVACGVLTLMALTGNLDPQDTTEQDPTNPNGTIVVKHTPILTINSENVLGTSRWQFYFFILALGLTAAYGYHLLFPPTADQEAAKHIVVVYDGKIRGDSIHIRDSVTIPK